ncbi:hypothetical protein [Bosea sp. 685]|uniref:hypothetical protein n=1 Tax=Bosea sp. 685 TaxID=3080057 RepID=UPI0028931642|nr:hypothetical protein [Bosea sp. 685]WNJ90952.1 hypothetical protein RMR04_01180 [Bosea sp. 685]
MKRARVARAAQPDPLAEDPLLARLARIDKEAKGHIEAKQRSAGRIPPRQRNEVLVTLADLDLVLEALRGARDEMSIALDKRLNTHRAMTAYQRADELSMTPQKRS